MQAFQFGTDPELVLDWNNLTFTETFIYWNWRSKFYIIHSFLITLLKLLLPVTGTKLNCSQTHDCKAYASACDKVVVMLKHKLLM